MSPGTTEHGGPALGQHSDEARALGRCSRVSRAKDPLEPKEGKKGNQRLEMRQISKGCGYVLFVFPDPLFGTQRCIFCWVGLSGNHWEAANFGCPPVFEFAHMPKRSGG